MVRRLKSLRRFERRHQPLLVISLVVMVWTIGTGSLWFLLPQIAERLTGNIAVVGLLMALPGFMALVIDIPVGDLSDRIGRKTILIYSLAGMAVLGLVLGFVSLTFELVIFLIFLGTFESMIQVPSIAYVMHISPKKERSEYLGAFSSFLHMGYAIGPIIGGFLLVSFVAGVISVGYFFASMSLLALVITVLMLKRIARPQETLVGGVRDVIIKDKLFVKELLDFEKLGHLGFVILFLTLVFTFYDGMVWMLEPLYYSVLGISPKFGGLILSAFVIPLVLFEVPAGYMADRFGKKKILVIGLIVTGAFSVLFGIGKNPFSLLIYAFLATTGLAMCWPSLEGMLADISVRRKRGEIAGVWSLARDFGYVLGPLMAGIIAQYEGIGTVFVMVGGFIILLVLPVLTLKD